jgi:hypothetical protein
MANGLASHKLNLLRRDRHDPRKTFRYFNDFFNMSLDDTTAHPTDWEVVEDAAAVYGISDKRGGWLRLECDGDDSDEVYLASRGQAFIFNTTDELFYETEVENTAVTATGDQGFICGLSDTVAVNSILDSGLIMASFDGACFILEENADVAFVTSNAGTQVRTAVAYDWQGTAAASDLVRLGFFYDPNDGVTAKIIPVVNGVEGTAHDLTISGMEEMNILFGVKNHVGSAQIAEWDWVEVLQRRNAATDIGTP